jgi:phosphoribosyl-dephospho-CoA transferase
MVARDLFAALLSRNEIDEPALRTCMLAHWQAIVQARRRIPEHGKLFARLRYAVAEMD